MYSVRSAADSDFLQRFSWPRIFKQEKEKLLTKYVTDEVLSGRAEAVELMFRGEELRYTS